MTTEDVKFLLLPHCTKSRVGSTGTQEEQREAEFVEAPQIYDNQDQAKSQTPEETVGRSQERQYEQHAIDRNKDNEYTESTEDQVMGKKDSLKEAEANLNEIEKRLKEAREQEEIKQRNLEKQRFEQDQLLKQQEQERLRREREQEELERKARELHELALERQRLAEQRRQDEERVRMEEEQRQRELEEQRQEEERLRQQQLQEEFQRQQEEEARKRQQLQQEELQKRIEEERLGYEEAVSRRQLDVALQEQEEFSKQQQDERQAQETLKYQQWQQEQLQKQQEQERLRQEQLQGEFMQQQEDALRQRQLQQPPSSNEEEEERLRQQRLEEEFNVQQELLRQQQELQELAQKHAALRRQMQEDEEERQAAQEASHNEYEEYNGEMEAAQQSSHNGYEEYTADVEVQETQQDGPAVNKETQGQGDESLEIVEEQFDEKHETEDEDQGERAKSRIEQEVNKLISEKNTGEQHSSNKRTTYSSRISYTNTPNDDDGFGVLDVEYYDERGAGQIEEEKLKNSDSFLDDTGVGGSGGGGDTNTLNRLHVNDINFPDPVDYTKINKAKIEKILRQRGVDEDGVMFRTTNVIYRPDVYGYIKMETYIQKVDSDGEISVNQEEHIEKAPERVTHKEQLDAYAKKVAEDRKLRKELGISFKVKSHAVDDDSNSKDVLFEETPEEIAEAERLKAEEEALTDEEKQGMKHFILVQTNNKEIENQTVHSATGHSILYSVTLKAILFCKSK